MLKLVVRGYCKKLNKEDDSRVKGGNLINLRLQKIYADIAKKILVNKLHYL
jgi:hypothetical protein